MAVIDNAFETKGTHLFFVGTIASTDPEVVKLTCPTGITGINGGTADRIDTTCLDIVGKFRSNITGLADADDVTAPFILYKADGGHQELFALHESGEVVSWMVGLSDSAAYPTLDTDFSLVTPADRTTFAFMGSVANLTIDANTNDVIRGTLSIRPTGATTPHWAA